MLKIIMMLLFELAVYGLSLASLLAAMTLGAVN